MKGRRLQRRRESLVGERMKGLEGKKEGRDEEGRREFDDEEGMGKMKKEVEMKERRA